MSKNLLQKLFRFSTILSSRIAGAAALFGTNLLIVHYLGLEALAPFAVFVSLVSILSVVISGGFTAIAPLFVAEYSKKQRPELVKGFVKKAIKQGLMTITMICIGLSILSWLNVKVPFVDEFNSATAVIAAATASALLGFNGAILVGLKKQVAGLIPDTFIRPTIFSGLTAVLLAAGLVSQTSSIMWLYASTIWLVLGFVWIRDRSLRNDYSGISEQRESKRWRKAAPTWMGISLLWDFMIDFILLLTSMLAGSVEIAILHICFRYRVLAGFGMRTIHTMMMPEITEQSVAGEKENLTRKLTQTNVASLAYSISVMAGFATYGDWLLGLFSIESPTALPILLIVSSTMLIRAVFGPAPLVLAIHNRHLTTLMVSASTTLLAIVFLFVTFGNIGILAAALGYTGANLFASATLWFLAKRHTRIDCSIFAKFWGRRVSGPLPKTHLMGEAKHSSV